MRKVELFEVIRRDHHLKGWGVRRLAREHQVGRRLVRQALSSAVPPPRRAPEREAPVLGPAKPFINSILVGDLEAPRKQRHTAHRIWQRVRDELGIEVAESTVRQYVGGLKRALGAVDRVTVPQVHDPGEEAEVDFFKAAVLMAGMEVVLNFFQMRACHSGRVFVQAVARATQQVLTIVSNRWSSPNPDDPVPLGLCLGAEQELLQLGQNRHWGADPSAGLRWQGRFLCALFEKAVDLRSRLVERDTQQRAGDRSGRMAPPEERCRHDARRPATRRTC